MKCPKCGAPVAPGDVFCGNCGTMVLPGESEAAPPPPVVAPLEDRRRKAMTIGIILVIAGIIFCLVGLVLGVAFAFTSQGDDLSLAESASISAICCLTPFALPGLLITAIGGVIWFVWGRAQDEEATK